MPKKVWQGLAMLVVGELVAWLLYTFVFKAKASEKGQEAATAAAAGLAPLGAPGPQRGLPDDPLEYAKLMQPRIAAMPSTSRVFDERKPQADPELYCMSSGDGMDGQGNHSRGGVPV